VRRLFNTFATGLPGVGLLILRLFVGGALVLDAVSAVLDVPIMGAAPYLLAGVAGILLLIGLWTPIAGTTTAVTEPWIILSSPHEHLRSHLLLFGLGIALAMIGPGAWSIDARLYGWKRIIEERPPKS